MKPSGPIKVEVFSCSGGMAEGFRRAGIEFDMAVDFAKAHVESYEKNIGHRPICMDARDLVRMVRMGWRADVSLLVADPPCTPWSRAGKRLGTEDERDMLEETCELIALLKPRAYLIGNVPGLDDSTNWPIVQRAIGGLAEHGYCVADFAALDAANYGVPQHRIRPFWFGHLAGPCIRWPAPTHCDPQTTSTMTLPGVEQLTPWVTCRQALSHLSADEIGRRVKLRKRDCNGKQHGSVPDRPARVVGTSNLSDGNVLLNPRHPPAQLDEPSPTIGAKMRGQSQVLVSSKHPALAPDEPATTIRGGGDGHSAPAVVMMRIENNNDCKADEPARTITAAARGTQLMVYEQHHPPHDADEPANTIRAGDGGGARTAMRVRDVGRTGQGNRVGDPDKVSATVTAKASRVGAGESHVLSWPWDRPSTTVQCDERLGPPGSHDDNWNGGLMSDENAIVLSERAATILQGFPDDWTFCGETKRARWSQIGQAMPPPLAEAVARSVRAQLEATDEEARKVG